jgi:predicted ArsR family transcriptional regulator
MAAGLGPLPTSTSRVREAPGRAAAAVLAALEESSDAVTVAALSDELGQHPNTVREHLDALVEAGLAERTRAASAGRGRPAWLYAALPAAAAGSREYAGLATALAMQLARTSEHPSEEAATAGHAWGASLATVTRPRPTSRPAVQRGVVDVLDELGFDPQTRSRSTTVRLRRCPLLEAAREQPEVVCSVHLGIVRGAMDTWGADSSGVGLVPFAEPGACLLHLASPDASA